MMVSIIIFVISLLKFGFPFSLVSSFILSSKNLEYGDEEHHEWLQ